MLIFFCTVADDLALTWSRYISEIHRSVAKEKLDPGALIEKSIDVSDCLFRLALIILCRDDIYR